MIIAATVAELKHHVAALRSANRRIGFVPTMGNLHAGHRHLMEQARRYADAVVASIYVNPLQFGPSEDFQAYPRTPEADRQVLEAAGVDLLFTPTDAEVYPRGRAAQTTVAVPELSDILCGANRPGHFRGVTTVVNRLFNLVRPDVALFGKKDYQQLLLIRLMVADLGVPVEIIGIDTVRDTDGLALSSRNGYLSDDERRAAPRLYATLIELRDQVRTAGSVPRGAMDRARQALTGAGFRVEYIEVRSQRDLSEPTDGDRQLVILAAAWLGRARLIDNLELSI